MLDNSLAQTYSAGKAAGFYFITFIVFSFDMNVMLTGITLCRVSVIVQVERCWTKLFVTAKRPKSVG